MKSLLILGASALSLAMASNLIDDPTRYPSVPDYGPQPNAPYMVDNQHNWFQQAPDKGTQNGPSWGYSRNGGNVTTSLDRGNSSLSAPYGNRKPPSPNMFASSSSWWLPALAPKGVQPLAGKDYKFFRNVVDDFHADNTGNKDATEAINAAVLAGDRCGEECGNTFSSGAIIYFPPGTYKICRPIVQLYYTQFIGDPHDRPIIKGCDEFEGIALIDTDPYIPGGGGTNWYINQNQFFRQIRNFVFDLRDMPAATNDHDQALVPTGIHWQVSQACSLQNLHFKMPVAKSGSKNKTTHVGIFMENGSGGFVSDLSFEGGNIGWRAGSQQYTALNLQFKDCLTSVQMVWDWGFNWQRVEIDGGAIGFNISGHGGSTGQGIGSVSIIDSNIKNCPIGILTASDKSDSVGHAPNIVLDNVGFENVASAVADESGVPILKGSSRVHLWATGSRFNGTRKSTEAGDVHSPDRAKGLLDNGKLYYRPRPQYEDVDVGGVLVATDHGCKNDGSGDNTVAVNAFLLKAQTQGKLAYFPAGIYRVSSTVTIPTGSRVVGSSWSQIQGAGAFFNDMFAPKVVVRVGNKGDKGKVEISDMMFTVQGATAGAIVLEWNVHESEQGSAAMWDSHVRIGGATGTDLDFARCPRQSLNDACMCATLMMHVTAQASGYFENVWVWLADHDNDMSVYWETDKTANQISLFAARGTLIESRGPSWFYGTGSEHAALYQYQLYEAKDIYLGHIQSETPYYQPAPIAPQPFDVARRFPGDPSFAACKTEACKAAWGLRIINSEGITVHGAGLYSFFQDYQQPCVATHDCQERICEVRGSKDVVLFNLFTVGSVEAATGINHGFIAQNDTQSGFSTEISVWVPEPGGDTENIVYVGTEVFSSPSVTCSPPCILVFPTSARDSSTVIDPGPYTTSLEYGAPSTVTLPNGAVVTTFITTTTTITMSVPKLTVTGMPYSNARIDGDGQTTTSLIVLEPSVDVPPIQVPLPDGQGGTTTRSVTLPPWPAITRGPPDGPNWWNPNQGDNGNVPDGIASGVYHTPFVTTVKATGPTVTTVSFPSTVSTSVFDCAVDRSVTFNTPRITITPSCIAPITTFAFTCPATKVVTFLGPSEAIVTADCTIATSFSMPTTAPPTPTTSTTSTPLPIWATWPGAIAPIPTPVKKPEPEVDGIRMPCKLWFFSFCVDNQIGGWRWPFPAGIYGPGPPPPPILPPGFTLFGKRPPWPRITIFPDQSVSYEEKPDNCEPETASMCSTSVYSTITVSKDSTSTVANTATKCYTLTGCSVSDKATSTASTTTISCARPTDDAEAKRRDEEISKTQQPPALGCPANALVYPRSYEQFDKIQGVLDKAGYQGKYQVVGGTDYVLFWWVPYLDFQTLTKLNDMPEVAHAYQYEAYNKNVGDDGGDEYQGEWPVAPEKRTTHTTAKDTHERLVNESSFDTDYTLDSGSSLQRRATVEPRETHYWPLSHVSSPRGELWPSEYSEGKRGHLPYLYYYKEPAGEDQWVYVVRESGLNLEHTEIQRPITSIKKPSVRFNRDNVGLSQQARYYQTHGTSVVAQINGKTLGVCDSCGVVFMGGDRGVVRGVQAVHVSLIQQLNDVWTDVQKERRHSRAVINMSGRLPKRLIDEDKRALQEILKLLHDKGNVMFVTTAGNDAEELGREIQHYPAQMADPNNKFHVPNLIVVGATDADGLEAKFSQNADWMTTFGPGSGVWMPDATTKDGIIHGAGTSFAAPQVAALIGYLRSLDSPWKEQLKEPRHVKKMLQLLHRRIQLKGSRLNNHAAAQRPVIWNGQVGPKSCLVDYDTRDDWDPVDPKTGKRKHCPNIEKDLDHQSADDGEPLGECVEGDSGAASSANRRDGLRSCPLNPNRGDGDRRTISFTSGSQPSPTCKGDCGGKLCTGYWCDPTPTAAPPDYHDPKDPNVDHPGTTAGDGDDGLTSLPPLTQTPTPITDCAGEIKPTTSCNGSGGKTICVTSSYCATTSPAPTPTQRLCQLNRGCKDFPCPSGQHPWCSGGHCTCRDKKPPEGGQECLTGSNCQSYNCSPEKDRVCGSDGYCACESKPCARTGDCSGYSCGWRARRECAPNSECGCESVRFYMRRTVYVGSQGGISDGVLQDGQGGEWKLKNTRDGCRKFGPVSFCVDEKRNRMKLQLDGDDMPRCLVGGTLEDEGPCPSGGGVKCAGADWDQVECSW